MLDKVIVNGRVAEGTGNPLQRTDIAVEGGRIVGIGRFPDATALEGLDDVSTLDDPVQYVRGIDLVVVNGVETVRDGNHTGARAGTQLTAA